MSDGDLSVEGGEGGDEAGGGAAMNEDNVRLDLRIGGAQLLQKLLRQAVEGLVLGHDVQVFIDTQAKVPKHLLEHFAVLASGADVQVYIRPLAKQLGQGRHFDSFRACAKYHHDCVRHCSFLVPCQGSALRAFGTL
ncbi:hypothetical protein D3C77_585460 [compost metagenome]